MYLEPYDLPDRVAAVTGDGRGIGLVAAHAWRKSVPPPIIAKIDAAAGPAGVETPAA